MAVFLLRRLLVFCVAISFILIIRHIFYLSPRNYTTVPSSRPFHDARKNSMPRVVWRDLQQKYPVPSMIPLPSGTPADIPQVQHDFAPETDEHRIERRRRLRIVKDSFVHTWNGYKKHAWMQDEVAPLTGGHHNGYGGWGATMVDTLDTLLIMGLDNDFADALAALEHIDFAASQEDTLNVFESTIRYLGGLLSAYDLSEGKFPILLDKAVELGDMLYCAFDTPNRMPIIRWAWKNGALGHAQEAPRTVVVAEMGSLTLEFTRLSQLSGNLKYYDAVQRISDKFEEHQNDTRIPGLWPMRANANVVSFSADRTFTLGGNVDSLVEYFPKQHMMLGGLTQQYRDMYAGAIEAAKEHIFFRPLNPGNQDILVSGTVRRNSANHLRLEPQGQHLACFAGGTVGIAAKIFGRLDEMDVARKLVDGCIWAYESMPTGIMPESFHVVPCARADECQWSHDKWLSGVANRQSLASSEGSEAYIRTHNLAPGFTEIEDPRYLLRPEAIESVFVLYRITGDTRLQEKAWKMFESVVEHTRTDIAFSAIADVTDREPEKTNHMESFWTAETLKYFYLIFSDPDVVSLDEYVFNTEAHPFKRPKK